MCGHGRMRNRCKVCTKNLCPHKKERGSCGECVEGAARVCEHNCIKSLCAECETTAQTSAQTSAQSTEQSTAQSKGDNSAK